MGYSETKYVLHDPSVDRSMLKDKVIFNHIIILDGRVAGHWKRTIKKESVIIEAALYMPFDGARRQALQAAADKHGNFLNLPASVETTRL